MQNILAAIQAVAVARIEAANAEVRTAEKASAAAKADLAKLRDYVRDLEGNHQALLPSDTWRALEPARRLVRFIRRQDPPAPFLPRLTAQEAERRAPLEARRLQSRIQSAFDKAKSGFMQAGLAELIEICASPDVDRPSRLLADRAILLLRASSPDRDERDRALADLDAPSGWGVDGPAHDAAVLKLSLLQSLSRDDEAARLVAGLQPEGGIHPDLLLLSAHQAALPGGKSASPVARISAAFRGSAGVELDLDDPAHPATIDDLRGVALPVEGPGDVLISVIVPAFNCADTIRTSLTSLLGQSWRNIEVLVVDDASTDGTTAVVAEVAREDARVRLIELARNGGAYHARNTALALAQGELVTCQDADDWSHPERLRRQADHLRSRRHLAANVSHWARATPDLHFERRPFSTKVIHFNSSSIMFRRQIVLGSVGFWDSVRFGGDTEFWHRLQAVFGKAGVEELPQLLAIGRVREGSLSRARATSYQGGKTGARKVYERAYADWHATAASARPDAAFPASLRIPFPLQSRPFCAPAIMRTGQPTVDRFDAVLISDFRHSGGTSASNVQELVAQARAGIKTAVLQVDRYDFNVSRGYHPDIQALIADGTVQEIVYGDEVTADVAVVRFPPIFSTAHDHLPTIHAGNVMVVVNQPPRRVVHGAPFYSIDACRQNVADYLGTPGLWVPIGPAVRDALLADDEGHHLSDEYWYNIIDVDAWKVDRPGWRGDRPVIGRHSRDAPEKWMTQKADLLAAYPDDGSMIVRILGGASVPASIIGHDPGTWQVEGFNTVTPRDFLATLDFLVFFPHEQRIEAFGRTIIEGIASGCLTILPRVFEPLFGEAAVYATPAEVKGVVHRFYEDRPAYVAQVGKAERIVRDRFGFEQHVRRLRRAMRAPRAPHRSPRPEPSDG